jgi:hypothetical protein
MLSDRSNDRFRPVPAQRSVSTVLSDRIDERLDVGGVFEEVNEVPARTLIDEMYR